MPKGRKYYITLIAMAILLAGFGLTAASATLVQGYPELVTGIIGLVLVYCGGNVSNKFVLNRKNKSEESQA